MRAFVHPLRTTLFLISLVWAVLVSALAYLFARRVVTPPGNAVYDTRILGVEFRAGSLAAVSLPRNADTLLSGEYSLVSSTADSLIRLGEVIRVTKKSVQRRVRGVRGADPRPGDRMKFCGWQYLSPADLNMTWNEVRLGAGEAPFPAWFIPAASETSNDWAVHIHGRATQRAEALRSAAITAKLGLHALVVSYRNDAEVLARGRRRYSLGYEEWRDVEHAMEFAAQQGAQRIVLYGWSMGSFIALQIMKRSTWRSLIAAAVLDSPALDWRNILRFQGESAHLPVISSRLGIWMLKVGLVRSGRRGGLPLTENEWREFLREARIPVLILHSEADGYVPITPAETLARDVPSVTLVRYRDARHVKLWNQNPEQYRNRVTSWLHHQLP